MTHLRIALVGMYGGMWGEYNPGCYMTCLVTCLELRKRLPEATIDIFSIHGRLATGKEFTENRFGIPIRFFAPADQIDLLTGRLCHYDALVVGGDIIWGGDDIMPDYDIFFLNSTSFLTDSSPLVLFNCVHTFYDDERIKAVKGLFVNACRRASYVSVRTQAIVERLRRLGIENSEFVPDLVLDLDCSMLPVPSLISARRGTKPRVGISIRARLVTELKELLRHSFWSSYEVYLWPFSRQYDNLWTVEQIRDAYGDRFQYIREYLSPLESFSLIGTFDVSISDTYHGSVAAVIHGRPFISIDIEREPSSRKDQLLALLHIDRKRNIRLMYGDTSNGDRLVHVIPSMITDAFELSAEALARVRSIVRSHFDTMGEIIRRVE